MAQIELAGALDKMALSATNDGNAMYQLVLGEENLALNNQLEKTIQLEFQGQIHCRHCQRLTNKSFSQGFCYPCFKRLAQCDTCMMSPEKCHFHLGTCREPDWAERVCFSDHIVYLANSSGLKVGITRATQMPTRWLDQGATQALPIARVASRRLSGLLEDLFRGQMSDRTNWRAMLRGDAAAVDLESERDNLFTTFAAQIDALKAEHGESSIELLRTDAVNEFSYPVIEYPTKIVSHNLEKTPIVSGTLLGLKGQYIILDTGVMNLRKYTSYQISFALSN